MASLCPSLGKAYSIVVGGIVGTVVLSAAIVLAPIISLFATPYFLAKAIPKWIDHRKFYKQTLVTNQTRAKFGRIEGQDYTQWNGKVSLAKNELTRADRLHADIGKYMHGYKDRSFESKQNPEAPFKTTEDLDWLKKEFVRKEKEDLLDADLKMLRASAKALIPLAGIIWLVFTETMPGGASMMGCEVCMMSGMGPKSQNRHWSWRSAIEYHQSNLKSNLGV